jgi:ABC-type glycerol-3-phosphate transport system permease component
MGMSFLKKKKPGQHDNVNDTLTNFLGKPTKWVMVSISTILVIFPLYWLFTSAIKYEEDYLANPPVVFPERITFKNFVDVFANDGVGLGLYNSLVVAIVSTVFAVLFGSLAAYAISKGKLGRRTSGFFALWFLLQKMYPAIGTAIPIYVVMSKLHLIDTKLAMIILNTSFNLPMVIWLMMGFFREVPSAIEEYGMIDGCSMNQRFFYLILPITKPGLIASAILTFIGAWNEFLFAAILTVRNSKTLPAIIAGFITDRGLEWGPMAATGVVIILPVLILVWAMQKDFVKGLTMGSVK